MIGSSQSQFSAESRTSQVVDITIFCYLEHSCSPLPYYFGCMVHMLSPTYLFHYRIPITAPRQVQLIRLSQARHDQCSSRVICAMGTVNHRRQAQLFLEFVIVRSDVFLSGGRGASLLASYSICVRGSIEVLQSCRVLEEGHRERQRRTRRLDSQIKIER